MKPKHIKKLLVSEIKEVANKPELYCFHQDSDFTRKRKLSMETALTGIIGMGSGSLTNELIDLFYSSLDMPIASAFTQQRNKIKPEAFKAIFDGFLKDIMTKFPDGMPIFAVDGSDIQIATNPDDSESYFPEENGQKGYNLLHLNARGYESYNNMAHIQEKGWHFLIRVKDGKESIKGDLELLEQEIFDMAVDLKITRKQSNEVKKLLKDKNHYRFLPANADFDYLPAKSSYKDPASFFGLHFRIVRFRISEDTYETVLTNPDKEQYPARKLKQLYASRWGIETSFRNLKYTIGMLDFHSKKVMCIQQEIYAHLIMYNFAEMITPHVVVERNVSILGEMQGENAVIPLLGMIADDLQILQLAEDCYWTVLVFSLTHEIAHVYLASIGRKYTKEHPEKEEFDADEIAYHIILKIIIIRH